MTAEDPVVANTSAVIEIGLRPPFMVDQQLPSLNQILAANVPAPSIGEPFSQAEKELLNYLLTSHAERSHVKSGTGAQMSWKRLAKRYLYWARVARVLGMNQFRARSDRQLKQKIKDDNKKKSLQHSVNCEHIADVWSYGVTLYVMIVGAYSFKDSNEPINFRTTIGVQVRVFSAGYTNKFAEVVVGSASKGDEYVTCPTEYRPFHALRKETRWKLSSWEKP